MGNTVAPRMCRKDAGAAAVTTRRRRRRPNSQELRHRGAGGGSGCPAQQALSRHAAQRRARAAEAGRNDARGPAGAFACSTCGASLGADDDADAVVGTAAEAVVTVKIVLKRKDAEALVARLNAQSARERKARMDELKDDFRAGGDRVGGASPTPCRDAWKPRLAPIKEN